MTTLMNFHEAAVTRQRAEAERRRAEERAEIEAACAKAHAEGSAAEKRRLAAIMLSDEAKANPELAWKVAFEQMLPADQALGILRASGRKEPPPADIPTIAQRAEEGGVIGASFAPMDAGKGDAWAEVLERTKAERYGKSSAKPKG